MSAPTPVSAARIKEMLAGRDLRFGEGDSSEVVVPARNAIYYWTTSNPQILQLRAHWRGVATDGPSFAALAEQIAACNSSRTGPKAYLAPFEDGTTFGLIAECNVVAASGLTPRQLDTFCETSMAMIMGFFSDLEAECPELVTWKDEEDQA